MKRNHLMMFATVVLCLLATPLTADDKASQTSDPSGTYHWTQDFGAGEQDNWLVLYADGENLTGSYISAGQTVPLQNGKVKDGKFSFDLELEVDGSAIETTTTGSVKGDKLTAVAEISVDGNSQESDIEADRKTRPEDVVGTWNLTIEAEGQVFEPVAKVTKDGDKLAVEYLTDEFGDHSAIDVELTDNSLNYTIAVDAPEGSLKLKFTTHPRGNKVFGEVEYEVGDITGSAEVEGEKEIAVDPVGVWNVVIEAEGQVFEPVMKVTRDGGDLKVEYLTDEFGDHEAIDVKVDGDKLVFKIAVDAPEGSLELKFDTKIAGDELTGEVEYQVGDITGSADVEGKREVKGGLEGTWNVTVEAEGQVFEPTVEVTKDGDQYVVEYKSDEFGDHKAVDVKVDGDNVSFVIAVDAPEGSLKLTITAKIDGDKMDGEVEYEVGDITGTADLEAERE